MTPLDRVDHVDPLDPVHHVHLEARVVRGDLGGREGPVRHSDFLKGPQDP